MSVRSWWVLAFSSSAILFGSEPCRLCHEDIARGFALTGMGRSISVPGMNLSGAYYHRGSNRHYRVAGGTLRRHQVDAQGREVNVEEKSIDLFIGSGNHAMTPVHRSSGGRLLELPLTWYASDKGGYWAMSPGYDRSDHLGFRREITAECVFCHSASSTPSSIDCARCHGSTAAHLEKPGRGSILNPAKLDPVRQVEICLQCHLETASSGITDSIRRVNRDAFSFRPGEPLGDYKIYFDRVTPASDLDINHAGYSFLQSACYRKSKKLTCTTCHNPHRRGVDHRAACQGCHHTAHAQAATDCVSCHMPRRRTRDAVHVMMTDHRVWRHPPQGDPLAPRREPAERYSGPLVRFYPPGQASREDALYLASAQVREDNNLVEGIEMLRRAIRDLKPRDSVWYWDLAEALRRSGDAGGARRAYRDALARDPGSPKILTGLADLLLRLGDSEEAEKLLRRAAKADPRFPAALNTLAIIRGSQGRIDEALRLLKTSLDVRKDLPSTWINLGVAYEHAGDRKAAAESYREAIRLQPDSSEARRRLSALH